MGGGVETALDNNWSAKFKALYVDLGGFDTAFGGVTDPRLMSAIEGKPDIRRTASQAGD